MGDWEEEDFVPAPLSTGVKGQWDDEDADQGNVKSSWDEEEEDPVKKKERLQKAKAERELKESQKKAEQDKLKKSQLQQQLKAAEPVDPIAQKARNQKIVEESDFQNTRDIFDGGDGGGAVQGEADSAKDEVADIKSFNPQSAADFERFAAALGQRLSPYEGSIHFTHFVKALLRSSCTSLKVEDLRDISSTVNVLINDKLKKTDAKKPKKKGPAPTAGKKVGKDAFDDYEEEGYFDGDDSFM